jgi:hypothetical protein
MKTFFQRLWEQEKPSKTRAARKLALGDALDHLQRWADYGTVSDLDQAVATLREAHGAD